MQRDTVRLNELIPLWMFWRSSLSRLFLLEVDIMKTRNEEDLILCNNVDQVTEETLFSILDFFEELEVPYWLDGGWGIDVLTGQQNREHRDVDIDFDARYTKTVISKLKETGYIVYVDWMPARMELKHDKYGYLDIHPIDFNSDGSIIQANPFGNAFVFQKEWFTSTNYKGREIPCISKKAQLLFHSDYELTDKDYFDIDNLNSIQ